MTTPPARKPARKKPAATPTTKRAPKAAAKPRAKAKLKPKPKRRRQPAAPPVELDMSVVASVKRDIAALAKRAPGIESSGHAALAISLAKEMDAKNSATSKSMCARALSETLEKLEALAPPDELPDGLDDLARRRADRRKEVAS